jgi:heme exporter protein D
MTFRLIIAAVTALAASYLLGRVHGIIVWAAWMVIAILAMLAAYVTGAAQRRRSLDRARREGRRTGRAQTITDAIERVEEGGMMFALAPDGSGAKWFSAGSQWAEHVATAPGFPRTVPIHELAKLPELPCWYLAGCIHEHACELLSPPHCLDQPDRQEDDGPGPGAEDELAELPPRAEPVPMPLPAEPAQEWANTLAAMARDLAPARQARSRPARPAAHRRTAIAGQLSVVAFAALDAGAPRFWHELGAQVNAGYEALRAAAMS